MLVGLAAHSARASRGVLVRLCRQGGEGTRILEGRVKGDTGEGEFGNNRQQGFMPLFLDLNYCLHL